MRKFLLLIAVALFSTATYAQLWNASISAVGAMDAVDFNSPATMDKDGNLYVTGEYKSHEISANVSPKILFFMKFTLVIYFVIFSKYFL